MKKIRILVICILIGILSGCFKEDGSPIANAGPDQTIVIEQAGDIREVELSGEASFDPNGDFVTHHWSIQAMPDGSTASLSAYTGPQVTLTIDEPGMYVIGLIVDDGVSRSNMDTVNIAYVFATGSEGDIGQFPNLDPGSSTTGTGFDTGGGGGGSGSTLLFSHKGIRG
ncbi:MAG: PKD domain-containing protein, partial [Gammaproteobacteria bacterium]|nr:PKD domain-containing protein [Gammaproteobacteria bacterium]